MYYSEERLSTIGGQFRGFCQSPKTIRTREFKSLRNFTGAEKEVMLSVSRGLPVAEKAH
jgi:hypothetical protein